MAIFGFKKRNDDKLALDAQATKATKKGAKPSKAATSTKTATAKKVVATKVVAPALSSSIASNIASVIIRPRITEKSGVMSQIGVYTFEVVKDANKDSVAKAINALYKVNPVKIAIINTPTRRVFVRGRRGTVSGIKKAVVTVKKGDKIDFV